MVIGPRNSSEIDTKNKQQQQQEDENDTLETPYGSLPASRYRVEPSTSASSIQRRSPVGSALRSIFGLQPSPTRETQIGGGGGSRLGRSSSKNKVATIVRHASLRTDPRFYDHDYEFSTSASASESRPSRKDSSSNVVQRSESINSNKPHQSLGSDLLHRASKKLSASSSSLTSKFKFISSSSSSSQNNSSPIRSPIQNSGGQEFSSATIQAKTIDGSRSTTTNNNNTNNEARSQQLFGKQLNGPAIHHKHNVSRIEENYTLFDRMVLLFITYLHSQYTIVRDYQYFNEIMLL